MDLLAHYYVAYAIGFLLMGWGLSVSELSQLPFSSLPDHFLLKFIKVWNMLKLANPRLVSLKNKSHFLFYGTQPKSLILESDNKQISYVKKEHYLCFEVLEVGMCRDSQVEEI